MRRDYGNDYPSVTQVLGILRKIGLENWFKYNTAQFCNEKSKKGKEIGTEIHKAIQDHIDLKSVRVETQYAEEVKTALQSFMLFKKEHPEIKLTRSEIAITNEIHHYNGTLDCIGDDGKLVIVDWKTGECKKADKPSIYDEYIYQVAAYVHSYNQQLGATIDRAYILCFAKDRVAYNMRVVEKEELFESFKEVFVPALKIYNYQRRK